MLITMPTYIHRSSRFAVAPGRHILKGQSCRFQDGARVDERLVLALPVMLFQQLLRACDYGPQVVVFQGFKCVEFHFSPLRMAVAMSSNGGSTSIPVIAALISAGSVGFSLRISATSLLSCSRIDFRCPSS